VSLASNAIGVIHIPDGLIDTTQLADDAVDSDEIAAGAIDLAHMSSQSVDEDNLYISNSGTNGQFLSKQSGNNGGLTWADAGADFDTAITINDSGADVNFRVESSGNANRFFIDGGSNSGEGAVIVGHNASLGQHRVFQIVGNSPDTAGMEMFKFTDDTSGPTLSFTKSRGGSLGANTIVNDGDQIGAINWFANDGTDTGNYVAIIHAEIDGTPGTDDTPGALVFKTTDDGTNSPTERMRIDSGGFVGIGVTDPAREFEVSGPGNAYIRIRAASGGSAGYELQNINERWTFFANDNSSDQLEIKNDAGIAMTITTAGAVDIAGTLDVAGAIEASGNITGGMSLYTTRDQVAGTLTAGYDLGYLYFGGRDSDSGWHRTAAVIRADVAGTWTSSSCATELQFATTAEGSTSSTQRMVITEAGKVGIGGDPGHYFDVHNTSQFRGTMHVTSSNYLQWTGGEYWSLQSTNSSDDFRFTTVPSGGAEHFRIAANGTLTATDTSIGSNSDSRLKENIENYSYDINKFKSYEPRIFDWKNPEQHGNISQQIGFIAQEQEIIDNRFIDNIKLDAEDTVEDNPDIALIDEDRLMKTSKFGQKDAMYVSVIKQLITRLETAEAKIAVLEG